MGIQKLMAWNIETTDGLVSCQVSDVAKSRRNFGFLQGTTEDEDAWQCYATKGVTKPGNRASEVIQLRLDRTLE